MSSDSGSGYSDGMSAAELRTLPLKDTWTEAEALALYEPAHGDTPELLLGAPVPMFVQTTEQRVRWSHAGRTAVQLMGQSLSSMGSGQLARTLYQDRATYSTD